MLYILLTPFAMVLADYVWITWNTHKGIYSHLRNDQKDFFSLTAPFSIPITVIFRPDLSFSTTIWLALFGWAAPLVYLLLKLDTNPETGSHSSAALNGLELAAVVYTVFNATSYLTFPIWRRWVFHIPIAFIDTMWGCTLYTATSVLAYELAQW